MNRNEAARFNAERRAVVAQLIDGGTEYIHEIADELGANRSTLNKWLRKHAPDLNEQVKRRTGGHRQPRPKGGSRDVQPPPPRSQPAPTAMRGVNITPAEGPGVLVVCGHCHRAFPRPTIRRGEQFAALHARLHKQESSLT